VRRICDSVSRVSGVADTHFARVGASIVEVHQQRRFARAIRADDADRFAARDAERDVMQLVCHS
jgi:hypothetical protein